MKNPCLAVYPSIKPKQKGRNHQTHIDCISKKEYHFYFYQKIKSISDTRYKQRHTSMVTLKSFKKENVLNLNPKSPHQRYSVPAKDGPKGQDRTLSTQTEVAVRP